MTAAAVATATQSVIGVFGSLSEAETAVRQLDRSLQGVHESGSTSRAGQLQENTIRAAPTGRHSLWSTATKASATSHQKETPYGTGKTT